MKKLATILAAITIVACQNQSVQSADYFADDFSGEIAIIGVEMQKGFEEEAFAVAIKNTKRLTDAVVLENSRRLSKFAETRRPFRVAPEFGQVSVQSMEFGKAHTEYFKWVLPSAREMSTVRYCTFPD